MLLKNNGFFLLELLLSLSVWFMIGTFFLPLLIDLSTQSQQQLITKKANQFLFEALQANLMGESNYASYSIQVNGTEYKVFWGESAMIGKMEVCVKVEETMFKPQTELCAIPE
jgi:competence protein ComGE